MAYATIAQVKEHLPDSGITTDYDAILTALVTRASRAIDRFTKRHPDAYAVASATTRYFDGSGSKELWVDEMASAPSSVSVAEGGIVDDSSGSGGDYTPWASSDFLIYPYNASDLSIPYTTLIVDSYNGTKSTWYKYHKAVKITASWGYSVAGSTPEDIVEACITQSAHWFKRGQQGFAGESAQIVLGRLKYTVLEGSVIALIEPFVRGAL